MHNVSATWRRIFENDAHRTEVKLSIAGTEYGEGDIVRRSLNIYGGAFGMFGIGSCCARQLDVVLVPKGEIPRQAKIEVFCRLALGSEASEWIPKGVFFFSTRQTDRETGTLRVHAYDAMLKAEETWLDASYDAENWPMPAATAVADICERMGVALDSRTTLDARFPVPYPADEEGDMTMREVLGRIAAANAGNFVITDEGKLLLLPLNGMPEATHYLIDSGGSAIVFGETRILV